MMNKDKKRLLFVISYLHIGGAERALAEITRNLPKEWEIDILLNGNQPIEFEYRGNLLFLGIDEKPKMASVFFHAKILYRRLVTMRKLKRSGKYMACISFLDSANVANILTKTGKCKTIISVRNSLKNKAMLPQYKYIVNPLVKMLYNKADWIVAVSRGLGSELIEHFSLRKDKVVVIENGYDIEQLNELGKQEIEKELSAFLDNKKVITTVGRLTDAKGQWHIIRAFSELAAKMDNVVLMLVGGGKSEGYLREVVNCLGLNDKVFFVGTTKNPYKYVSKSDVFVLSSLFEGFPNAMAEAICLGIPCVATDFQTGARELLAPSLIEDKEPIKQLTHAEFGVITPCCSGNKLLDEPLEAEEVELSKAMYELLNNDGMRAHYAQMSRECRLDLGIDRIVKKYEEIIL